MLALTGRANTDLDTLLGLSGGDHQVEAAVLVDPEATRQGKPVVARTSPRGDSGPEVVGLRGTTMTPTQHGRTLRRVDRHGDAHTLAEQKAEALQAQVNAYRELSTDIAHED